jgi:hypothetical protein
VQVRVMLELLAPGVQHRQAPNLRPEMRGVASDVQESLGHSAKQQGIEHTRILEGEGAEVLWEGKDGVDIRGIEDLALSAGEPRGSGCSMTLGAVPIAARVITDLLMATLVALRFVAAEGRGAAQRDGPQRPVLFPAQGGPAGAIVQKPTVLLNKKI